MLKFTEIKINKKITVFSVIMITALIWCRCRLSEFECDPAGI